LESKQISAKMEKPMLKTVIAITINEVVNCQSTEGSWKDIGLFERLYNQEIAKTISTEKYFIAIMTYLIAKWIEKNYPQKQYMLVIKKGINFAKK